MPRNTIITERVFDLLALFEEEGKENKAMETRHGSDTATLLDLRLKKHNNSLMDCKYPFKRLNHHTYHFASRVSKN